MLSEILLEVVSFVDYATLVMLRLTSKQLLCFSDRYADQLAFRRTFAVLGRNSQAIVGHTFHLEEIKDDNSHIPMHTMQVDDGDEERLLGILAELHSLIGPHTVHLLELEEIRFHVKPFVERVPAVRHASEVYLAFASGCSPSLEEYAEIVYLFERPIHVSFWQIATEALVAFLEIACASQLKDWTAWAPQAMENDELEELAVSQENVVLRFFFDLTYLEQDELKRFTFIGWNLRWDVMRRLIEAADTMQHFITLEVSKPDWIHAERLELDNNFVVTYWRLPLELTSFEEKSVAIGDFLRKMQHAPKPWTKVAYFSKRSDLVVFIGPSTITITNNPSDTDLEASYWL